MAQAEGYLVVQPRHAPLAGLEAHALAPFWQRVGAFTYRHGEHFTISRACVTTSSSSIRSGSLATWVAPGGPVLAARVLANVGALGVGRLKGLVSH